MPHSDETPPPVALASPPLVPSFQTPSSRGCPGDHRPGVPDAAVARLLPPTPVANGRLAGSPTDSDVLVGSDWSQAADPESPEATITPCPCRAISLKRLFSARA